MPTMMTAIDRARELLQETTYLSMELWNRADVSLPSSVKGERVDAPRHYRFYLKRNGHTFAAEFLECASDSDAMVKAKELLALSTTFHLMEVWQGTRNVGTVERGS